MLKQTFKQHLILLFLFCGFLSHSQISGFNLNDEGWRIIDDAGSVLKPDYNSTGGNPGGFVSSMDVGAANKTWYFAAPSNFLGNKSWFYGRNLQFQLKQSRIDQQFNDNDIILEGNGTTLYFKVAENPKLTWTAYSVRLDETANWRVPTIIPGITRKATQSEIKTVLCKVSRLWIRGEYATGADEGGLDNVIIEGEDCKPNVSTQNQTICKGRTFSFNNKTYTLEGTYRDTIFRCNPLCDSIIVINLKVIQPVLRNQALRVCAGDSVKVGTRFYSRAGTYTDSLKTVAGCDSIVLTTLTVNPIVTTNQKVIICEGDIYRLGDSSYTQKGSYRNKIKSSTGCDSIILTELTVNARTSKMLEATICPGKIYRLGSKILTQAGVYTDTIRRRAPLCDSIVTVKLTLSNLPEIAEKITICRNDSIYVRGRLFNAGGAYRDTIKSFSGGCDTVVVTNISLSNLSVNLGSDIEIEKGDSVKLTATLSGGQNNIKWTWSPPRDLSCLKCGNPTSKPQRTVTYIVEARDTTGNCAVKDNITISVKACEKIFIPTAFSPNNDGTNDMFIAYGANCAKQIKKMAIFSRGGQMVFNKQNLALNSPSNGWDGTFNNKLLPTDVYVYVIEIEFGDGEVKTFSGDLDLMR
jgi:gliding motility-associated-like protein